MSGRVAASFSHGIAFSGTAAMGLSRTATRLRGKLGSGSTFAVDLGEGAEFVADYYTLRHGGHKDESPLTNWELQGSKDGQSWDTLRAHTNDKTLHGEYAMSSWPVDASAGKAYRMFRVLDKSPGRTQLSVGGFELYGSLRRLGALFHHPARS
mmetsp:Transcript_35854/g.94108  ORF Transcript_35854/g.94108 Transcript_35854/m.94108 type:complete len:153 (+) Transcript_35854:83-541(+)